MRSEDERRKGMKIVEIWMGGSTKETYRFEDVKRIEMGIETDLCRITLDDGFEYETSTRNILIITPPKKGGV
jgi:hypothetical protein